MKKTYLGYLLLASVLSLASCADNLDLSKYEVAHSDVFAKYEETAVITYNTEFSLDGIAFHDFASKRKTVSKLVPGDKLNIYYTNDVVEYVFVEKAKLMKIDISISTAPGDEKIEMYTSKKGIAIDSSKIDYIIKSDSSYIPLKDYSSIKTFFGTYNPENNVQTTDYTTLIKLEAVFAYSPR